MRELHKCLIPTPIFARKIDSERILINNLQEMEMETQRCSELSPEDAGRAGKKRPEGEVGRRLEGVTTSPMDGVGLQWAHAPSGLWASCLSSSEGEGANLASL